MAGTVIPCLPFASLFEKTVASTVKNQTEEDIFPITVDPNKICGLWSGFSFNLDGFVKWLRKQFTGKVIKYRKNLRDLIDEYFLKEDIPSFEGIASIS